MVSFTQFDAATAQIDLASGDVVHGTAAGIAEDGSLLVRSGDGVRAYPSGEVVRLT